MELSKNKGSKIMIWVLALVLAGIWGEVGYWLIWGEGSSDEGTTQESTDVSIHSNKSEASYDFIAGVRDPFSYRNEEAKSAEKVVRPAVQIWIPPPLRLKGVISKGKKRTAIIEGFDGKTFFESPGDTLYGVKILAVNNEGVKYRYEKKDTSWAVER